MSHLESLNERTDTLDRNVHNSTNSGSIPRMSENAGTLNLEPDLVMAQKESVGTDRVISGEPIHKSFYTKMKDALSKPFRRKKRPNDTIDYIPRTDARNFPSVVRNPERPPENLGGRDLEDIDLEDYDYYDIDEDYDDLDYEVRKPAVPSYNSVSTIPQYERDVIVTRHEVHEGTVPHCTHFTGVPHTTFARTGNLETLNQRTIFNQNTMTPQGFHNLPMNVTDNLADIKNQEMRQG